MPIKVYPENEILRIDCSGDLAGSDFEAFDQARRDFEEGRPHVPHRIADLSQVTNMGIGFSDVAALAAKRKALKFPNAFKTAIVAPLPVHVGFARMFQTLNDHPQITIQIFSDLAAAKAWLAETPALTHTAPRGPGS